MDDISPQFSSGKNPPGHRHTVKRLISSVSKRQLVAMIITDLRTSGNILLRVSRIFSRPCFDLLVPPLGVAAAALDWAAATASPEDILQAVAPPAKLGSLVGWGNRFETGDAVWASRPAAPIMYICPGYRATYDGCCIL